jgi:enolase
MNTAERLIRSLCDEAEEKVTDGVVDVEKTVPVAALPAGLRKAVETLNALRPKVTAAKAIIKEAGYETGSHRDEGEPVLSLQLSYEARNRLTSASRKASEIKRRKIRELRNAASVDVMNKSGEAAKTILNKLRADLAKV